jgi:hypothetical protein
METFDYYAIGFRSNTINYLIFKHVFWIQSRVSVGKIKKYSKVSDRIVLEMWNDFETCMGMGSNQMDRLKNDVYYEL